MTRRPKDSKTLSAPLAEQYGVVSMQKVEFIYKIVDGQSIAADVYYNPEPTQTDVAKPIALYAHGGGFVVGSKDLFPPAQREELLHLGFVVVSANYRLAPTVSAANGAVADIRDCLVWVQTKLPSLLRSQTGQQIDPQRVVAVGHSCGGTLALTLGSMPNPPLAIADFFGMKYLEDPFYHQPMKHLANLPSLDNAFLGQIESDIPPPSQTPPPFGEHGPDLSSYRVCVVVEFHEEWNTCGAVVPRAEDYEVVDPVHLFKRGYPPTVFVHGAQDTTVAVRFSEQAYDALQAVGTDSKLIVVDYGDHGFDVLLERSDPKFKPIADAYAFLASHV